jgi:hypothetical protein
VQVYHHFNDAAKSCECCINTLQRQLAAGWRHPSTTDTTTATTATAAKGTVQSVSLPLYYSALASPAPYHAMTLLPLTT